LMHHHRHGHRGVGFAPHLRRGGIVRRTGGVVPYGRGIPHAGRISRTGRIAGGRCPRCGSAPACCPCCGR
jgi:hypothetical protein